MKKAVWSAKALVAATSAKALIVAGAVALAVLVGGPSIHASQQPPAGGQEGFVPVENLPQQEQLPAAPLVMGAYAVAWVAVFGYLWSIWRRLGSVERDILDVSRRIDAGGRR
jgi:CcmD family protein